MIIIRTDSLIFNYRHKQNTFESIRSDRNLFSKQLLELQGQINELKQTFRSINYSIEQLKDEISSKDHSIVKDHFLHHAVDKERELLNNEIIKIKKQINSSIVIIDNQSTEILKLNHIIEEANNEKSHQSKEYHAIRSERNVLTSQIIKRNTELSNIYNIIKLQKSNLILNEARYFKIINDIKAYKEHLKAFIESNEDVIQEIKIIEKLKYSVIYMGKISRILFHIYLNAIRFEI